MIGSPHTSVTEPPCVIGWLRRATRAAHGALEARPLLRALAGGTATRHEWADFLEVMASVHGPLEDALDRARDPLVARVWRNDMRRSPAVAHDLASMRPGWQAARTSLLATIARDARQLLGALYVVEGARLGGLVLRARIQRAAWAEADGTLAYLSDDATTVRRRWTAFCERMNATLPGVEAHREAAAGALATFTQLGDAFDAFRRR